MSTEIHKQLLAEFPGSAYEDWCKAATKLLKRAPFEKKLFTKTYEEITLRPIYMQHDMEGLSHMDSWPGSAPYVRGRQASGYKLDSWKVAQELPYNTLEEFNRALKADLICGQTAVNIILDKASQQGLNPDRTQTDIVSHNGVSIATIKDLTIMLDGVDFESTPLFVWAGVAGLPFAALLAALFQMRQQSPSNLCGCVGIDPLGMLASEGTLPCSLNTVYPMMTTLTKWAKTHAPQLKTLLVQGTPYHESGGSAVQELAFTLATGVEYLREMQERGLAIDEVAPRIQFVFSIGSNYFMEIAKLRAARLVWAKVVKAFGGNDVSQNMTIHGRTALWNKTLYDSYVNMLRATTEAFAGIIGGCDSLHVGSFDEVAGAPDDFLRRIARNTHLILKEEAHLHEVIDPAGGAWCVEALTDEIARHAWTLFQEVENIGGMAKALEDGFPQKEIGQTALQRKTNLAIRKDVLVGTNMYPNLHEKPLELGESTYSSLGLDTRQVSKHPGDKDILSVLPKIDKVPANQFMESLIHAALHEATLSELMQACLGKDEAVSTIEPVHIHREAEMFEKLRAATDAYTTKTGTRPRVFLANMGPLIQHKARADFSSGFFAIGGFEMIANDGFHTVEDATSAASGSQAPVVVICSTDETYLDIVPPLTQQIKTVNPDIIVVLAGYPKDHIKTFKNAGIDEFIHLRANAYEILARLLRRLNILE